MSVFDRLLRALGLDSPDMTLDHVPAKALEDVADWRDAKVRAAAERHAKPFKCAADSVPRERFVGAAMQKEIVRPRATVTPINRSNKRNPKERNAT